MDVIIHLAAIVGAPACKNDTRLAQEVNHLGTANINNARDVSQKCFMPQQVVFIENREYLPRRLACKTPVYLW